MAKVYYRWSPIRRGLTGAEYLGQFCNEYFPNVTVTDVISDGVNQFSIVEGTGDEFRKAIRAIETKFSAQKLTEDEVIGAIRANYNPSEDEFGTSLTWDMYATNLGFTVDVAKELEYVQAYKLALLKEQARLRFPEWNDSLADVAKSIFAKLIWYEECTTEEQTTIDNAISAIKQMYTKDACIKACLTLASNLQQLSDYYNAKQQVLSALTVEDVLAVDF